MGGGRRRERLFPSVHLGRVSTGIYGAAAVVNAVTWAVTIPFPAVWSVERETPELQATHIATAGERRKQVGIVQGTGDERALGVFPPGAGSGTSRHSQARGSAHTVCRQFCASGDRQVLDRAGDVADAGVVETYIGAAVGVFSPREARPSAGTRCWTSRGFRGVVPSTPFVGPSDLTCFDAGGGALGRRSEDAPPPTVSQSLVCCGNCVAKSAH